jgi:gas vesicle protein
MRELFGFVVGVAVGAMVGMLLAPMSGRELREKVGQEAEAEMKKAQAEWSKALEQVQQSVEATRRDLEAYIDQAQAGKAGGQANEVTL